MLQTELMSLVLMHVRNYFLQMYGDLQESQ